MKSTISALHNRRRILFLLCGGIGLCATNSIGQVGYAQPANNSPKRSCGCILSFQRKDFMCIQRSISWGSLFSYIKKHVNLFNVFDICLKQIPSNNGVFFKLG